MNDSEMNVSCEEIRELEKENPEQAAVIIEMLKAAGEQCQEAKADQEVAPTEH